MERLKFETGGRPETNDDLVLLQTSTFDAIEALFQGRGAFVITGCAVTVNGVNHDVSSGIVFIDGKIMRFAGATNVALTRYLKKATDVDTENRVHETGGSKPTQTHISAELVASAPGSGEYITITTSGGRSWYDAVADEFVRMTGAQTIAGLKTMALKLSQNMDAASRRIFNLSDPVVAQDAATKAYVDLHMALTGNESISGTKTFADLHLSGDANAGSSKITNLADPTGAQHAVTRSYMENYVTADVSWTTISLINSWVVNNGRTVQYRINKMGQLEIRGMLNSGTSQFFCAAGTCPAAFRPPSGTSSPNYIAIGTSQGPQSFLIWADGSMSIPGQYSSRLNIVIPKLT